MKKHIVTAILTAIIFTFTVHPANAQMMGSSSSPPDQTAIQQQQAEEQEGKKLLDELKNKTTTCQKLTDDNFEKIGEYFMGQAIGDTSRHIVMNNMMKMMMGENGESEMHIAWGKRGSRCQPNAPWPQNMMSMMMGGGGNPMMGYDRWNNMMGGWNGFGILGWIPMFLFWLLLILGVIALIRYLGRSGQDKGIKAPLDILKERYARGEIDRKEFNKRRKDL